VIKLTEVIIFHRNCQFCNLNVVIRSGVGRDSSVNIVTLRAERSGDRIPVGARFSAPVQNGPGVHPASCTMGTGSFPGVKRPGCGVDHPPYLVPKLCLRGLF